MNIEFDSEPVYGDNDKYIKTKIKIYEDRVSTNFQGKKVLNKNVSYKCHTFKAFIIIIKTLSYLLKINKRTNKKYLCDGNCEIHLYHHIYIYERCFLVSR